MSPFDFDLAGIFSFTVSPLELMLRGTLMYWFLYIVLPFILRRDVGSLGISDFLFVVILGDAAQNSMIGSATSATDGMVLIGTLVFWSFLLDFMSFQFPLVARFTSAPRICLVRDGRLQRRNMRREPDPQGRAQGIGVNRSLMLPPGAAQGPPLARSFTVAVTWPSPVRPCRRPPTRC